MNDDRISVDRMRYTKNTTSSRLVYLAILFDVLYFVSIYKLDLYIEPVVETSGRLLNANYLSMLSGSYYTALLGGSIILNLVFMLVAFLCSEGVKNYQKGYSKALIALAVLQVARIFVLPTILHNAYIYSDEASQIQTFELHILNMIIPYQRKVTLMDDWQFVRVCVYLIASSVCLLFGARVNAKKSGALRAHIANLESLQA